MIIYNLNQVTNISVNERKLDKNHKFSNYYVEAGLFRDYKHYFKDKKYRWVSTITYLATYYDSDEEFLENNPNLMIINGLSYKKPNIVLFFSDGCRRTLYFSTDEEMYIELEKIKGQMTHPEALYYKHENKEE